MKKRTQVLLIGFSLILAQLTAQDNVSTDPLLQYRNFYEIGISINGTRVNTDYTQFNTSTGVYNFNKNKYLPAIEATFNYGWLFSEKKGNTIWTIKTGGNLLSRAANLVDSAGHDLRLSTGYLQVPVQFGFHKPLKYNTVRNNLFRAIELNAGVYSATPFIQKLDYSDNLDSDGKALAFNYFRFGLLGEIIISALNQQGYGHKFGIRASYDFPYILKIKETENELYPYYLTIGFFYNLANKCIKGRR